MATLAKPRFDHLNGRKRDKRQENVTISLQHIKSTFKQIKISAAFSQLWAALVNVFC